MLAAQRPVMLSPRFLQFPDLLDRIAIAEKFGVDQLWVDQQPDERDATLVAATYLRAAPSMSVGTAAIPVYARHPIVMAQAAGTLAELSGGRFVLGLGFSHQFINEYVFGYESSPAVPVMREYVSIVRGLLTDGNVGYEGVHFTARAQYRGTHPPVPIFLAALRPQMIRLAVRLGDGILLWLCSPSYVREHVMPVVLRACDEFGKDPSTFPVIAIAPAYAGAGKARKTEEWTTSMRSYRALPYYRHVLTAHGSVSAADVALIGSRTEVQDRAAEYRTAGAVPVPSPMPGSAEEFADTLEAVYGT